MMSRMKTKKLIVGTRDGNMKIESSTESDQLIYRLANNLEYIEMFYTILILVTKHFTTDQIVNFSF
jgi:hypothetical protein